MNKELLTSQRIKFIVVLLCAFLLAPLIIYKTTLGNPSFCGLCHMMKPEFYTHQASTHKKLSCTACHLSFEPKALGRTVASAAQNLVRAATGTYVAPIKMIRPMEDKVCDSCHNMNTRVVSSSIDDLVIPHDKHKKEKITCSKCHSGLAHGNIDDRKVTYEADYQRWDSVQGEAMMSDLQYTIPDMDFCMRCHQLRKVTTSCKACHPTGMMPKDHRNEVFQNGGHGKQAVGDLAACDFCHGYMSEKPVEVAKETSYYKKALSEALGKKPKQTPGGAVAPYSRENSYCRDCHNKRPPSHGANFRDIHGAQAKVSKEKCGVCHDNLPGTAPDGTRLAVQTGGTACGNCHPSPHLNNIQWQKGYHPIELPKTKPLLNKSCYSCHQEESCGSCHGKV